METGYMPKTALTGTYWARFLLLSFVVGAVAGTTGDFVHVITHVDGYPAKGPFPFLPLLPDMPVWVPFLFGSAVMLMATTHKLMQNFFHPRLEKHFFICSSAPVLFVTLYAMSGVFQSGTGGWEDVWLAMVTILIWWWLDRTIMGACLAVLTAMCGTFFEMFLVHIGGFYYYPAHSNMLGVPSWLPWLYMVASVCISLFVRLI